MGEENRVSQSTDFQSGIEQAGLATYVAASVFNTVALPKGMPDYIKRAIEAQAERERAQPGPIIAAGSNDAAETKEDRDRKAADRATEQLGMIAREQERRRDEWAREQHSFAGQAMTGAQWRQIADDLKPMARAATGWSTT